MDDTHSTAELHELVLPAMTNHHGTLLAGQGLQLMAKAAFVAAHALARCEVVMASVNGIDFLLPIPVGRTLVLRAWVSRIGRSSMTVCVHGVAELPGIPPEQALRGVFEIVAVDAKGLPRTIESNYLRRQAAP